MANNINLNGSTYDLSTYSGRQAARDANPGVIVDASSAYNPSTGQQTNAGNGGGGSSGGGGGGQVVSSDASSALGKIEQQLSNAISSGNKAAADEAIREFNQTFGLDSQKFVESVKEYNQNFGLAEAGITGTYNGAPTLAAQAQTGNMTGMYNGAPTLAKVKQDADIAAQAAGLTGMFDGTPTLAKQNQDAILSGMFNGNPTESAREFNVTSAQNALNQSNQTGLGLLNLAASLHSDPFRQLQVMYGAHGISGLNNAVNGLTSQYGLPSSFTAPAGSATNNLGGMAQSYMNAGNGATTGGLTPQEYAARTGLYNTNQIVARNFNTANGDTQNAITSALSANTGQDQADITKQIQNNLPKFSAPSFGLAAV